MQDELMFLDQKSLFALFLFIENFMHSWKNNKRRTIPGRKVDV